MPADLSVDRLIDGLEEIGNIACMRVLCAWFGKFTETSELFSVAYFGFQ